MSRPALSATVDPIGRTVPWLDMDTARALLSRHLVGRGLDLGPGCNPFPLPYGAADVSYVDRWFPAENRSLFPELSPEVEFPIPDYVCHFDHDRLSQFDDASQDFVIASHLLEHLADPIGMLDEIHRVVRPGGMALILLPDRRRTFDARRAPTPLAHVVADFEARATEIHDERIVEFLRTVLPAEFDQYEVSSPEDQRRILDRQRERSIHVHCWTEDEFLEVLLFAMTELGHAWDFVDGLLCDAEGPEGYEFGYVLRRTRATGVDPTERARRFTAMWSTWAGQQQATYRLVHGLLAEAGGQTGSAAPGSTGMRNSSRQKGSWLTTWAQRRRNMSSSTRL